MVVKMPSLALVIMCLLHTVRSSALAGGLELRQHVAARLERAPEDPLRRNEAQRTDEESALGRGYPSRRHTSKRSNAGQTDGESALEKGYPSPRHSSKGPNAEPAENRCAHLGDGPCFVSVLESTAAAEAENPSSPFGEDDGDVAGDVAESSLGDVAAPGSGYIGFFSKRTKQLLFVLPRLPRGRGGNQSWRKGDGERGLKATLQRIADSKRGQERTVNTN